MSSALKWVLRGVFTVAVVGGMILGGPRLATAVECDESPPLQGPITCPPLDMGSCGDACIEYNGASGGTCIPKGCCVCYY